MSSQSIFILELSITLRIFLPWIHVFKTYGIKKALSEIHGWFGVNLVNFGYS